MSDLSGLFLKPFKAGATQALRNSDALALRKEVLLQFPSLSEDDISSLFPKKSKIFVSIIKATNSTLYFNENHVDIPLFFRLPSSDKVNQSRLIPTLFTLWTIPAIIPRIYTYLPLVEKITGVKSVPLFQGGVWVPELPDAFFLQPPIEKENDIRSLNGMKLLADETNWSVPFLDKSSFNFSFQPEELRAVYVLGHPYAISVGISKIDQTSMLSHGQKAAEEGQYTTPWTPTPWPGSSDPTPFLGMKDDSSDQPVIQRNVNYGAKSPTEDLFAHRPVGTGIALHTLHSLGDELFQFPKSPMVPTAGFSTTAKGTYEVMPVPACEKSWTSVMSLLRKLWLQRCFSGDKALAGLTSTVSESQASDTVEKQDNIPSIDVESVSESSKNVVKSDQETEREVEMEMEAEAEAEAPLFDDNSSSVLVSAEEMSLRFQYALLATIRSGKLDQGILPIADSTLYSQYLRYFALCPSSSEYVHLNWAKSSSIQDPAISRRPVPLDVSKSTYKKFSNFVKFATSQGWIQCKVQNDTMKIMSVDCSHDDVLSIPFSKNDTKAVNQALKNKSHGQVTLTGGKNCGSSVSGAVTLDLTAAENSTILAQRSLISAHRVKVPLKDFLLKYCPPYADLEAATAELNLFRERAKGAEEIQFPSLSSSHSGSKSSQLTEDDENEDADENEDEDENGAENDELEEDLESLSLSSSGTGKLQDDEITPRKLFELMSQILSRDQISRSCVVSLRTAREAVLDYITQRDLLVKSAANQPPLLKVDQPLFNAIGLKYTQGLRVSTYTIRDVREAFQKCASEVSMTAPLDIAQFWDHISEHNCSVLNPDTLFKTVPAFREFFSNYRHQAQTMKWRSKDQAPMFVVISSTQINGKPVTLVAGTEAFGLQPEKLATDKAFKSSMACAVSCQPIDANRSYRQLLYTKVTSTSILYIQGHLSHKVMQYLINNAKIQKNAFIHYANGKLMK